MALGALSICDFEHQNFVIHLYGYMTSIICFHKVASDLFTKGSHMLNAKTLWVLKKYEANNKQPYLCVTKIKVTYQRYYLNDV